MERRSVVQDWVGRLTFMQQSVLLTAIRGPDGLRKEHVSKYMLRWLRRCILIYAFEGVVIETPDDPTGGSFTGPSYGNGLPWETMEEVLDDYLRQVDEIPHHFQLHFLHAAEILGYKHPNTFTRRWWNMCYRKLVSDVHLLPESEEVMDKRLGDVMADWRAAEEVVARPDLSRKA